MECIKCEVQYSVVECIACKVHYSVVECIACEVQYSVVECIACELQYSACEVEYSAVQDILKVQCRVGKVQFSAVYLAVQYSSVETNTD